MNELVYLKKDDAFTDSMVIAEGTGNQHKSVVKIIKKYKADFEDYGRLDFSDFKSTKSKGRPTKIYALNEQQATLLVTYLDNNETVRAFKKKLVSQFYQMRKLLAEKQTAAWVETRKQGIISRKAETDTIKNLVEYAKGQGSKHADMLYLTYTKLANKFAGISSRESATVMQLNNLSLMEQIILKVIEAGIISDKHYKEIYQDCKTRLIQFSDIAMIGG